MSKLTLTVVVITAVILVVTATSAVAQSSGEAPSCASKLTGCVDYLNGTTTPPSSCCDPLKEAVTNERTCLCSIYNNPDLVKAFQINITQARNLPKLCNIDTGKSPDICKGLATSPSSSTPSGSSSPSSNAAGRNTRTGLVGCLIFFGAYSMLY